MITKNNMMIHSSKSIILRKPDQKVSRILKKILFLMKLSKKLTNGKNRGEMGEMGKMGEWIQGKRI